MDAAVVYADIKLLEGSSSRRNLDAVQQSDHQPCPRWHWIALWVGWAGNIVLVVAVIVMGVWVVKKNPHNFDSHRYNLTGSEGGKAQEDFRSVLREQMCEAGLTENRRCNLCPVTWLLHQDTCYWFSELIQPWKKSKDDCMEKKSRLAVIYSQEQMEFLQQKIQKETWIGFLADVRVKKWVWINGSLLNQTLLPRMHQQHSSSCGALTKSGLSSDMCSTDLHWICQKASTII
ncbi:killer cell lectin-like receptor subfamily B member 1B allele A [Hemicordylus capensis]|uniref:killer cell lectin-like receptor subfamily B member 1B allele A n=1 Tax=Hemicordylus capensis TaxID=884348 RepID=UPI0023021097|nr:killer cell lectin-like receptor subfamily B member 1B allele A [Hemicordylus capensis]